MSELKTLLSKLGYNENQIESIANKNKIYFQDDVDNIVSKSKETLTEKYNKNFVSKADFDLIQSEYNNLVRDVKTKAIKDEFIKNGGNEKYFDDYIKLNSQLMDLGEQELSKQVQETTSKNSWAFNNIGSSKPKVPFGYQDTDLKKDGDTFDGETIYGKNWDNI